MVRQRDSWLAQSVEDPLEPGLLICDPHHHFWDRKGDRYLLDQLAQDLAGGHNVVQTVFIECHSMYRARGPEEMRSVGEVEFVQGIAAQSASGQYGPTAVAAGIVGNANLMLTVAFDKCLVPDVSGCRGAGLFFGSGDGSEVDGRLVFIFRDEEAANSALDAFNEGLENEMAVEMELKGVSLDGEFVIVPLSMDEKVFITELLGLPLKDSDATTR